MNLGIKYKINIITVQDLYDYAKLHNCLYSEATTVLDIMCRERNLIGLGFIKRESNVTPMDNEDTVDFGESVHYTTEDVLKLLS